MTILLSGEEIKEEMILPYCLYEDVDRIREIIEERDPESPKQIKIGDKLITIPEVLRAEYKFGFITTIMRMNESNGDITYNTLLDDIYFDRLYSLDEIGFGKGKDICEILKKKNDSEYFSALDYSKYWQSELNKAPNSKSLDMIVDYHKNVIAEYKKWYAAKQYFLPDKRTLKTKKYQKPDKIEKAKLFIDASVKTNPKLPDYEILSRLPESPSKSTWRRDLKKKWFLQILKEEIEIQRQSSRTPSKKREVLNELKSIVDYLVSSKRKIIGELCSSDSRKLIKGASPSYDETQLHKLHSKKELSAKVYTSKEAAEDSMIQELWEEEQSRGIKVMDSTSRIEDIEDEANPDYNS